MMIPKGEEEEEEKRCRRYFILSSSTREREKKVDEIVSTPERGWGVCRLRERVVVSLPTHRIGFLETRDELDPILSI